METLQASLHVGLRRHRKEARACRAGAEIGAAPCVAACCSRRAAPRYARVCMPGSEDDRFRVKPAAPKSRSGTRSRRFISQVLKQASKIGAKPFGGSSGRPGNTFGRGRVAAALAGQRLGPNARRVVIKSRFVVLQRAVMAVGGDKK